MSFAPILAENDGISIFGASILGASNLGMSNAGALGASGILKSILGACSNQPVSPVHDNLFYALSLAENDGISIFGAAGASNLGISVWKSNFGQLTPSTRRKRN